MATSNPLTDALPPRWRKIAYAVLFVGSLVFTVWQASDGDWDQFFCGLFTALVSALATSNVHARRR